MTLPLPVLPCRTCGHVDVPRLRPGSGPHAAGAECQACGAFLKWLPRRLVCGEDAPAVVSGTERK